MYKIIFNGAISNLGFFFHTNQRHKNCCSIGPRTSFKVGLVGKVLAEDQTKNFTEKNRCKIEPEV
jgi:hypothetical protein